MLRCEAQSDRTVTRREFGHQLPVPPKDLRHKATCARSATGDCTYLRQLQRSTTLRSRTVEGIANGKRPESGFGAHRLTTAAIAFAIGFGLHGIDHLRRGMTASPTAVMVGGMVQGVFVVVVVLLVLRHRRRASEAAVAVGFGSAALFVYAHLLPTFLPAFQDSFVTGPRINDIHSPLT